MRLALFTRHPENLPQSYTWEGQRVDTSAGIAFCQPFSKDRQKAVRKIVIAFKDLQGGSSESYDMAWEADIVAVRRSAPPYDTWGNAPRYDVFYANARRLDEVPERAPGPGFIRYIE